MKKLTVYSDCCSYRNGKPDQIGGFTTILVDENDNIVSEITKIFNNTTNNFNELLGCIVGLQEAYNKFPEYKNIEVVSDSQYVIKGATEWLNGWKNRNWKTASGGDVKNVELWKTMEETKSRLVSERYVMVFTWIKGHQGKNVKLEENRNAFYQEFCDTTATSKLKTVLERI